MNVEVDGLRRLAALEDAMTWVSIVRSSGGQGGVAVRQGLMRLAMPADELESSAEADYDVVLARVLDEDGVPIAVMMSSSELKDWNGVLHYEPRPFFRIEFSVSEPPGRVPDDDALDAELFAKALVAELEASLGYSMMVQPDPDPEADWRALYRPVFPLETERFTVPSSMGVSANMRSAQLHWGDAAVDAALFAPEIDERSSLIYGAFATALGSRYPYTERSLRRLASDLRGLFHGRDSHLSRV